LKIQLKKKELLYVVYTPSCKCEIIQDVVLDRYPMSEKIIASCPSCKKMVHLEVSNPIKFYIPILKKEYNLEDLKQMQTTDTWQKEYIELYKDSI